MPTLDEIQDRIRFDAMRNTYTDQFSLCDTIQSRAESLRDGIADLL